MKKKRRKAKLVPRLGPPQNVRPAGAHESKKRYSRKRQKAALEEIEDGFFLCFLGPLGDEVAFHHDRARVDEVMVQAEFFRGNAQRVRDELRQMERRQIGASPA